MQCQQYCVMLPLGRKQDTVGASGEEHAHSLQIAFDMFKFVWKIFYPAYTLHSLKNPGTRLRV
jgi:hypothetical protein